MADNAGQDPELQGILTDLDAILSDLDPSAEAAAVLSAPPAPVPASAQPPAQPAIAPPAPLAAKPAPALAPPPVVKPAPAAKPVPAPVTKPFSEPALAVKPAPAPAPAPSPAPASPPQAGANSPAAPGFSIELAPREGTIASGPKKVAAPSTVAPPPKTGLTTHPPMEVGLSAASNPPPAAPPKPAVSVPSAASAVSSAEGSKPAAEGVPAAAKPDEIRRAAIFFTAAYKDKAEALVAFLEQSAVTISKKPVYLRKMAWEPITEKSDANILAGKLSSMKVVAIIAVLEDLPEAKLRDFEETFLAAGLFFRNVPASDIQKRSMAVDLIVDVMLLNSEA